MGETATPERAEGGSMVEMEEFDLVTQGEELCSLPVKQEDRWYVHQIALTKMVMRSKGIAWAAVIRTSSEYPGHRLHFYVKEGAKELERQIEAVTRFLLQLEEEKGRDADFVREMLKERLREEPFLEPEIHPTTAGNTL